MLHCAQCHYTLILAEHLIYREYGDFVINCPACSAHNVLAPLAIDDLHLPIPTQEISGYHATT